MENIEIEYKVMINKDDYYKIISSLDEYKAFEQVNYYYDTFNNDLKKNNLSFRIRHILNDNTYLMTIKEKLSEGRKEYEFYLKDNNPLNINKETKDFLSKRNIDYKELHIIGKLKTLRYEIKMNNCLLCFDKNNYYNNEDYEVECEASSMLIAKKNLCEYLDNYHIKYTQSQKSKQKRTIENKI